jgi:hypothetical protein
MIGVLVVALVSVTACKEKQKAGPSPYDQQDPTAYVEVNAETGGVVSSGGVTVTVPRGALAQTALLGLRPTAGRPARSRRTS